jgi:two-component system NtrC family sensor kinase
MLLPQAAANRRILVVDDNTAIHEDFGKVLAPKARVAPVLNDLEAMLFDKKASSPADQTILPFELSFAQQGQIAVKLVEEAVKAGTPYAMAFVDIRMPPGWDGVETTSRMWAIDPKLQVVICSAYSDYSWEQMHEKLGARQQLLILKKPFDPIEVLQLAHALTEKWELLRAAECRREELEAAVTATQKKLMAEVDLREAVEAKLRHTQKIDALGRLAGGIAHEINNPLSFVLTNIRFVEDLVRELEAPKPLAEELNQATQEALAGADRIRRIVRDVKIFSQADAAPLASVDAAKAIARAVAQSESVIKGRGRVTVEVGEMVPLHANEEGLVQVLENLIINGAQAWPEGRTEQNEVRISAQRAADGRIAIAVRDNGGGIPAEVMPRLFDPFFSTKPIGVGTGLGLCICHGIVSRLGGEISVESKVGVGTTFQLMLPTTNGAAASAPRAISAAA